MYTAGENQLTWRFDNVSHEVSSFLYALRFFRRTWEQHLMKAAAVAAGLRILCFTKLSGLIKEF